MNLPSQNADLRIQRLRNAYAQLWKAVEDGDINKMFFELREKFRIEVQTPPFFFEIIVSGEDKSAYIAEQLVRSSAEFSVTPYPDNQFVFVVKEEHRDVVLKLIQQFPKFTVILAYPEDDDGLQTYINAAEAENAFEATQLVQQLASKANNGSLAPTDFRPIAVFAGDVPLELNATDFK